MAISPLVLPQATVFQEFTSTIPVDIYGPLRTFICGGHAALHRYASAAEKDTIVLGPYDPLNTTIYDWPGRQPGSVIDTDYAQLFIDNAYLRYYQDPAGSGDVITAVAGQPNKIRAATTHWAANGSAYPRAPGLYDRDVEPGDWVFLQGGGDSLWTSVAAVLADAQSGSVGTAAADPGNAPSQSAVATQAQIGGPSNYLNLSSSSGAAYDGSATGDLSEVYTVQVAIASTGGDATTARLNIASASGRDNQTNVVPAAFGTAFPVGLRGLKVTFTNTNTGNPVTPGTPTSDFAVGQTWQVHVSQVWVPPVPTSGGTFVGTASQRYTVVVTRGGLYQVPVPALPPGTVPTVNPTGGGASGGLLAAGIYTLKYTWVNAAGETTPSPASAAFTVPAAGIPQVTIPTLPGGITSANIYLTPAGGAAGTEVRYKTGVTTVTTTLTTVAPGGPPPPTVNTATVVGANPSPPQINASSNSGLDNSGPTNILAAAAAVPVGSQGVTIAFSGTGLRKGDVYTIPVTGMAQGPFLTLALTNNLTTALAAATDIAVTLYIKENLQVPEDNLAAPPGVNYVFTVNNLTVNSGLQATTVGLSNAGVPRFVPVVAGPDTLMYVQYREWLATYAQCLASASVPVAGDPLTVTQGLLGTVDPDNPLAYGLYKALLNANGTTVYFSATGDPTLLANWQRSLLNLVNVKNIRNLVPLTTDPQVLAIYQAHIDARSPDEIGGEWRVGWFSLTSPSVIPIVFGPPTSTATLPPTTSDGQPAQATVNDNPLVQGLAYTYLTCTTHNSRLVTNGVLPGDVVRIGFTQDVFGNVTWSEFIVAQVINEDTLVLETGPSQALAALLVEVWRQLTPLQLAARLTDQVAATNDARINYVWPDVMYDGGRPVPGYFLAAALAGFVAGIAPHQGIRYVAFAGFDGNTPASSLCFNNAQVNALVDAGAVVVTTDEFGNVYPSVALTSDQSQDPDTTLEQMVRTDDATRYLFYYECQQFFGKANITPTALSMINAEIQSGINLAKQATFINRIGSMISDGTIESIRPHATIVDRVVVVVNVSRNYPANDASVSIVI